MQEGLAKSAPQPESEISVVLRPQVRTEPISAGVEVPFDILRYFNADFNSPSKDLEQMKYISDWAFKDVETPGDGLKKLRDLELKLGQPHGLETRYSRLHRWIKLQNQIDEIRKKQEAYSG